MRDVTAAGLLILMVLCSATRAESIYREQNGLLVVETEAAPLSASWSSQTSASGFTGANYYEWKTGSTATGVDAAGQGILRYRFRISTTGRYRFQLLSAAPHSTEHNDVWFRFPTSGGLRMKNNTYTSIGTAWTKLYQNAGNNSWTWNSSTVDNDPHSLFADFNAAGDYDVELSGRSTQFKVDRFVLYHSSVTTANATNTANAQSSVVTEAPAGAVSGELKKWHKVTITFDGPDTSETAMPNPFTDYRLNVTFTKGAKTYVVPGYYAADGNAGESSATSGNKWRVHFAPDEEGTWNYNASFRTGANISVDASATAGTATSFNGATGSISVGATDKSGRDFRAKGRLQYVGERYLKFTQTNEYFVKAGPDSPENMLGFVDFDGTTDHAGGSLKTWSPHVSDWQNGDVTWKGGKGKGLVGAINYLANEGCNVFSFLTYNSGGDGKDVWPFIAHDNKLRYDCSKLDQWSLVFDHATKKGFYLHFKTQETENDNESPWALDGGNVAIERKLYYRELIARFGHNLALNWNLGEETTQTTAQHQAMAQYFYDTDPYRHNVVLHTYPGQQDQRYTPLLGNASKLTGVSIQIGWNNVHGETLKWVENSRNAGKNWIVANDEQGSADIGIPEDGFTGTPTQKQCRGAVLWGNLLAGGAGIESYFGYQRPHSDLSCQDFRSRDQWWDSCRHAMTYFNTIRFWEMQNSNAMVGASGNSKYCFAKAGEIYIVYLAAGGTTNLNLAGAAGTYQVKWYDPRNGGALQNGTVTSVNGGGSVGLGNAPNNTSEDWVIQVSRAGVPPQTYALTVNSGSGDGNYAVGTLVNITAEAPPSGQIFDRWTGSTAGIADVFSPNTTITMPASASTITATYKTGTSTQAITSLTLINADTELDIGPLANGATLNLAILPTRNLNVRANASPATVGSVRFSLDGNANYMTESAAPYALAGNNGPDYNTWAPSVGSHTLTATPYSAANGGGTAGTALSVTFTVIDQAVVTYTLVINSGSGDGNYTAGAVVPIIADAPPSGQIFDRWTGNTAGIADVLGAATTITMPPANVTISATYKSAGPAVTSFTLINADTDQDIGPLTQGMTLNLDTLPTRNLNVRANTAPATVGSVRFAYDGNANARTENVAPYAFGGDTSGNYNPWTPSVGSHSLGATPFSNINAGGTAGTALIIMVNVTGFSSLVTTSGNSGDTDGDGLSDDYERLVGLDPISWDSDGDGVPDTEEIDPFSGLSGWDLQAQWLLAGGGTPSKTGALNILKFTGRISFKKSAAESISIKALVPELDAAMLQMGNTISVSIGIESVTFVLDGKKRSKSGFNSLKGSENRGPKKKPGTGTLLDIKLRKGEWLSKLSALNGAIESKTMTIPITVLCNQVMYSVLLDAWVKGNTETDARLSKKG